MKTNTNSQAIDTILAILVSITISTASAQTVADGSFETPLLPSGQYFYSPTNSVWAFGRQSGILSPPGQGPWGNFTAPPAPSGAQMAFLQTVGDPLPSFFEQTVTLPTAGIYELSYLVAGRPWVGGPQYGNCQYDIFLDLMAIATGEITSSGQPFTPRSFRFAATAGRYVLRFQTRYKASDNTAFFDSIGVTPISTNTQPAELSIATYTGVTIGGVLGGRYVLEFTDRVPETNWTELTNVVLTTTPYTYYDRLSPTSRQRYYRAFQILQ